MDWMEWDCIVSDWIGMEGIGMDRVRLNWLGIELQNRIGIYLPGLKWNGVVWTGMGLV